MFIREGPTRCYALGIDYKEHKDACLIEAGEDSITTYDALHSGWQILRAEGDAHPDVASAMENVISCLEERGHADVRTDLLFVWQWMEHPNEHMARTQSQSDTDRVIEETLLRPSRECGFEHGLFEVQDGTWTEALVRLADESPDAVDALIKEGLLAHLQEPGVAQVLAGIPHW